jgi:hypothetical protein
MEIANATFEDGTVAKICFDDEVPHVALLILDDQLHSAVSAEDESFLFFEYSKDVGSRLDREFAPGSAIKALILGGGAYSIPRYIEATRPGSTQKVIEINHELIQFIDNALPLKEGSSIEVLCSDAYTYILSENDEPEKYDFILFDAYVEPQLEERFLSYEFLERLHSLVSKTGLVVVNIIDNSDLKKLLQQLETIFKIGASSVSVSVLTSGTPQGGATKNKNVLLSYRKS